MEFDSESLDSIQGFTTHVSSKHCLGDIEDDLEIQFNGHTNEPLEVGLIGETMQLRVQSDKFTLNIGAFESPAEVRKLANWFQKQADSWEEFKEAEKEYWEGRDRDDVDIEEFKQEFTFAEDVWGVEHSMDE